VVKQMYKRLVHSIAEACEAADTGRTALYEAINSGELRAVKRGTRTLILDEDLCQWVQNLPPVKVKSTQPLNEGGSNV
jgi:excisionase family DNA binding protein